MLAALLMIAACTPSSESGETAAKVASQPAKPSADQPVSSPGKPSAPVSIRYKILGTPVVGQPVAIEIGVSSSLHQQPATAPAVNGELRQSAGGETVISMPAREN